MSAIADGKTKGMCAGERVAGSCLLSLGEEGGMFRHRSGGHGRTEHEIKSAVTGQYPLAKKVVLDNLNTHTLSSLYETFPAEEAFAIAQRLEIHYTPKHGSWLDIAEIDLSVFALPMS
jgi:hypothetical protein